MNETQSNSDPITLTIATPVGIVEAETFNEAEVWALAHFIARMGWGDFSTNTADNDEAFLIKRAIDKLQDLLMRTGFAPQ